MEATEILLTGTYNAMREQVIALEHENRTLKAVLNKFLNEQKIKLEEIIEEMQNGKICD